MATLATPVGETTLGNYIFQGLNTRDNLATVFGCVFAALLAVVLDQLIRLGVRQRTQQHAVHDREHGGSGAGAERERQHRDRGERGLPMEEAERVADVVEERGHGQAP